MSTIYHKVGNSLPQPNVKISHWIKIIMAPNKTMAPFQGRFYLHKEAQNAQNAQTVVNLQKFSENSICTKTILFAQRRFYLFAQRDI